MATCVGGGEHVGEERNVRLLAVRLPAKDPAEKSWQKFRQKEAPQVGN